MRRLHLGAGELVVRRAVLARRGTGLLTRLLRRPEHLMVGAFAGLILAGAIVLRLPVSQAHDDIGFLDTLFTATSAVCVTGLITRDTATEYSRTGQTVIMILIQLGGLGVLTFGALAYQLVGRRFSFQTHAALQDTLSCADFRTRLRSALRHILLITFVVETLGALLLYLGLQSYPQPRGGWFAACFLAVAAFCNAGFSVFSDNVMGLRGSPLILLTLMGLITVGGLGYMVVLEVVRRWWRWVRRQQQSPVVWSLNSRVVLRSSAILVVGGACALMLVGLTPDESTPGSYLLNALFQSVTARTAGFNTVDIGALPVASLLILVGLMFIGGAPGSCAGGIKITSASVWLARVRARLAGRQDVTLGGRRIPHEVVRRAALVLALAALWNMGGVVLLTITEDVGQETRLEQVIFEQVSAFATVGLSTGLTPHLSNMGKLWIIATMFVGRLGPLTMALAVLPPVGAPCYSYPEERVMIG